MKKRFFPHKKRKEKMNLVVEMFVAMRSQKQNRMQKEELLTQNGSGIQA